MPVHEASAGLFGTGCPVHTNCVSVFAPERAGRFSLNLSGGFAVCGRRERRGARRGGDAVPTAVGKKEGTPAVSLPLWTPTFPLLANLAQITYM